MRILRLLMICGLATASLVACGNDDATETGAGDAADTTTGADDDADTTGAGTTGADDTTGEGETTDGNEQAAGGGERYCQIIDELDNPEDDPFEAATTEEEFQAAFQEYLSRPEVQAKLNELVQVAPAEIREEVQTLMAAVMDMGATGDLSVMEQPDVAAADEAIQAWEDENCPDDDGFDPIEGEDDAG